MRNASQFLFLILVAAVPLFASGLLWSGVSGQSKKPPIKLTEAERGLVSASRNAVLRSGMSPNYFDRHFTLVKVVNQPGDRRVVWKFSVNEYQTTVTDVLGYYTKDGKRFDTHGVTATLRATSDVKGLISQRQANQIMQQCIGSFRNPSVEYRAASAGPARLFLTAEAVGKRPRRSKREREREEREEREREAKAKATGTDPIENEGDKGPPIIVGSVDLQSGKCTKGELQVAGLPGAASLGFSASRFLPSRQDQH